MDDFNKRDKKILRELIGVCANREVEDFFKKGFLDYQSLINQQHEDFREPYWKIANQFRDFSKSLVSKYDNYSNSDLGWMVVAGWINGWLTEEDFKGISEEGFEKLKDLKKMRNRMER